jgi:hypothetical protein
MLARDPIEAADQARILLKEKPLADHWSGLFLFLGCCPEAAPQDKRTPRAGV